MLTRIEKRKNLKRRDRKFIKLFKSGKTLAEIGIEFSVTREYVRQRLKANKIRRDQGGQTLKIFVKISDRLKNHSHKSSRISHYYGCVEEFIELLGGRKGWPACAFKDQKYNAKVRKIEWELTFPEWWRIWQDSGKWEQRGLGSGKYVMSRVCDTGPYSIDNVRIITHNENAKEARAMDKVRKLSVDANLFKE